jgi:iron-sulfur cluster repair protein YtfE (RIC family)
MTTHASEQPIKGQPADAQPIEAQRADAAVIDGVDFVMMFAAHDAFERHLGRLIGLLDRQPGVTPATLAQWTEFDHQLHVHHTAEDTALWPPLQAAAHGADELAVLDAMEAEHAAIDPALEQIADRLQLGDARGAASGIADLRTGLVAHMLHEERDALPLVARRLGEPGWAAFERHMREKHGMRGAATYLPWLLDGAPAPMVAKVFAHLPGPVRVLYRTLWLPRYRRRAA